MFLTSPYSKSPKLRFITKTSPCNGHPLTPHFYIVKQGFTEVYFFLVFAPKHISWVLVSNVYPQSMFLGKNKKNIKNVRLKSNIFTATFLNAVVISLTRNSSKGDL